MRFGDDAHVGLVAAEGNEDTNTYLHLIRQRLWNGIGEEAVERHGQDNVDKQGLIKNNRWQRSARTWV